MLTFLFCGQKRLRKQPKATDLMQAWDLDTLTFHDHGVPHVLTLDGIRFLQRQKVLLPQKKMIRNIHLLETQVYGWIFIFFSF